MRRTAMIALFSALALQVAPMVAAQGVLNGHAQNSAGQALANQIVQARDLKTGQIAGTSITNGTGAFSFSQLTPAQYIVEIIANKKVVGVTAPVVVAAGAVAAGTVAATASAAVAGRATSAPATAPAVVAAASAAGVRALAVTAGRTVSPSR